MRILKYRKTRNKRSQVRHAINSERVSMPVGKGDTVKFAWRGEDMHNVKFTKAPKGAKKPRKCGTRTNGSCKRKLKAAGTYKYVCTLHEPGMKGKIRVR